MKICFVMRKEDKKILLNSISVKVKFILWSFSFSFTLEVEYPKFLSNPITSVHYLQCTQIISNNFICFSEHSRLVQLGFEFMSSQFKLVIITLNLKIFHLIHYTLLWERFPELHLWFGSCVSLYPFILVLDEGVNLSRMMR